MKRMLTVVMYHYVRDLSRSRFPDIKGLETALFRNQLEYLSRFHTFVTPAECLDALAGGELPPNPVLLTFDDGLADHYQNALPIMKQVGARAVFFVNAKPLSEGCVMDVHKIHFILASCADTTSLLREIREWLHEQHAPEHVVELAGNEKRSIRNDTRYDLDDVVIVKRLLQRDLPEEMRRALCRDLFERHVAADESEFSAEFYLNPTQLREMSDDGFAIGNHGYDHVWLNSLAPEEQSRQIAMSRAVFSNLLGEKGRWLFSYPYGAYDQHTKQILEDQDCGMAFAAAPGFATLEPTSRFELLRFDTNDFPKERFASPNALTQRGMSPDLA